MIIDRFSFGIFCLMVENCRIRLCKFLRSDFFVEEFICLGYEKGI